MVARAYNPSYSGGWGRRIAWTQEVEVAVSRDVPLHSSLGNKSETLSQKKKKNMHLKCFIYSLKERQLSFFEIQKVTFGHCNWNTFKLELPSTFCIIYLDVNRETVRNKSSIY